MLLFPYFYSHWCNELRLYIHYHTFTYSIIYHIAIVVSLIILFSMILFKEFLLFYELILVIYWHPWSSLDKENCWKLVTNTVFSDYKIVLTTKMLFVDIGWFKKKGTVWKLAVIFKMFNFFALFLCVCYFDTHGEYC